MAIERRAFLRGVGSAALVAPFAAARFVVDDEPEALEPVRDGEVLTAAWMNRLVDRVNQLSKAGRF